MAEFETRSRSPASEPPLTLADRGGRRASRPRGPAPVTLLVSLLLLAAVVAAAIWLYRSGARHAGDAPQPVGAPLRDVRTPAPPQSQPPDAAGGLSIYKDQPRSDAPPTFVSPPEEPGARPGPQTRPAAPASSAAPAKADALGALIDQTASPPSKAARVASAAGPVEIQIGAFSSQRQADEGWSAAAAAAPGPMAGKGKRVAPFTRGGETLYRTFITGFASREAAVALCARLQAAQKDCLVR